MLPNGDVLVAEQSAGYLTLLREGSDGKATWITRHVEDLNRPYGLAWRTDHLLVTDQDAIWRVPHVLGAARGTPHASATGRAGAAGGAQALPGAYGAALLSQKGVFGVPTGHQNRPLAINPATGALFVGVGSSGNLGVEPEPKATIQRFEADGGHQTTYTAGVRNPTGLAFHPQTGDLWAVVQERDGLGDNLPSDYLIRVQEGGFYGWPYAYIGPHPQPGFAQLAPDKVKATLTPDLLFEAHSSALDLVFYDAAQFPAEMQGSAFVALKGSWNRSVPTGYKVVRVPFTDGKPVGYYENFMTGSGRRATNAPRYGAGPPRWPLPRTGRFSSPMTPAARSGRCVTRAKRKQGRPRPPRPAGATAPPSREPPRRMGPSVTGRPASADRAPATA